MLWFERFERLGRIILWLSLAAASLVVPFEYMKQSAKEAELRQAMKKAETDFAEAMAKKAEKPPRLSISSMGSFMTSVSTSSAEGHIFFTNATPRSGTVCVYGVAHSRATQKSTTSMAACREVAPYASTVSLAMMFAGGDLHDVCGEGRCELEVTDVQEKAPAP